MAFRGNKVTYYSHSKHFKVSFKTGEGQGEQGKVTCVACRASSTVLLRRQLTHCLPRDHRDWPQDLCMIPARSRQRITWTALSSSVKGGGPAWSLRWGVWDRGLQKPLSIHLAHYISIQITIFLSLGLKRLPRDQTGGFDSQNGFCRQVAVTKAGFLSQITSVVSFKCHSGH